VKKHTHSIRQHKILTKCMKRDITLENFLNGFDLKTKLNITCIQFNTGDINIYISVIMYLIVLLFFISFLSIYTSFFCEC